MRAGKLRHLVTINRYTPAPSPATGEQIAGYTPNPDKVWASIEPLGGRELVNAQQVTADSTHRIRMRYTPDVGPLDQILFNGRTFEIEALNNFEERNIELMLVCHEIT